MKKEQSISTPSILGFQPFRFEVVNTPKGTLGHSHSIHVNVIEAQGSVSLLGTIFWMSYGLSVASNQPKWFKWSTQSKCNVVEYIEKDRTVFISQSDLRVLPDMCVLSSFAGSKPSHNHKSHKISFAYHPLKVPQVFCVFLWLGWALAAFYVSPQWPSSQLFVPVPPSHVTAEHFGLMSSAKLSRSSHLFFGVAFSKGKIGLKKTSGAAPAWAISAFARRCASFNSESSLVIRASAWHWWRAWSCRGTGRLKHADVRCFCCYLADASTDSYGVTGFLGHSSSLMY